MSMTANLDVRREQNRKNARACWHRNKDRYAAERKTPAGKERQKKYRETWLKNGGQDKNWDTKLRKKYGITADDYVTMMLDQGGVCKLCDQPEAGQLLAVDHCHKTGKVRGLLCKLCNTALGKVEGRISLKRLSEYIS